VKAIIRIRSHLRRLSAGNLSALRQISIVAIFVFLACACIGILRAAQDSGGAKPSGAASHGVDLAIVDKTCKPCEDFFRYASGEWLEATDYIDVVAWGPLGERVAQYLTKGRRCLVQGRLQSRSWEQDGQKRSKVEVNANDVTFLDSRGSNGGDNGSGIASEPVAATSVGQRTKPSKKSDEVVVEDIGDEPINLDDIPF